MRMKSLIGVLFGAVAALASNAYGATNLTSSSASTVSLETQCGTTSNCAESMYDLLNWIWNTRNPSASSPLLVNIGAGTFAVNNPATGEGMQFCNNSGYVTFRGAGRGNTTLVGNGAGAIHLLQTIDVGAVVFIHNCNQLAFENLTISAPLDGNNNPNAVNWKGGGNSTWNNVELNAAYYAWLDVCDTGSSVTSTHSWFGSSLLANSNGGVFSVGYRSDCGTSEIYGSKIMATKALGGGGTWSLLGVQAGALGHVEIYGSSVKTLVPASTTTSVTYSNNYVSYTTAVGQGGLLAKDGGVIHMHGGVVSVRHEINGVNSDVFGARTLGANSMIHTPDTAYGLDASGTGVAARILTDGSAGAMIMAPYQWPQGDQPPAITSMNGADTFVEIDCNTTGICTGVSASQQVPHMMIYKSSCVPNGPWFDTSTNKCRQ